MSKNAKSGNCSRGGEKRLFLSKDDVKPNNLRIYEKKWHEKQNPTNMLLLQGGYGEVNKPVWDFHQASGASVAWKSDPPPVCKRNAFELLIAST